MDRKRRFSQRIAQRTVKKSIVERKAIIKKVAIDFPFSRSSLYMFYISSFNFPQHLSMDIALMQPHIIRKVFSYLQPIDVYHFGQAQDVWKDEAIEWLKKCPKVDEFTLIRKDMRTELSSLP